MCVSVCVCVYLDMCVRVWLGLFVRTCVLGCERKSVLECVKSGQSMEEFTLWIYLGPVEFRGQPSHSVWV